MPVNVQDVLKINIVFVGISVLGDPGKVSAFSKAVGTEVVPERGIEIMKEGASFASVGGRLLALQRDRIRINSSNDRTIVEREFPSSNDLERLAKVADEALQSREGDEVPRAFGYNLELVYDQTSGSPAFQYIAKRLFREDAFAPEGWDLEGGAGWLHFGSSTGRWKVQIEPRFRDETSSKVFLTLNFHKEEQRVPDLDEMLCTFRHVWSQSHDFAKCFDEGGPL